MGLDRDRPSLRAPPAAVILLDTHAVLWLQVGHPRGRPLARRVGSLYVSPVSLLEIQFLVDAGRVRLRPRASIADLAGDARWALDDPPAVDWFFRALDVG